jgi:hypothetical protein
MSRSRSLHHTWCHGHCCRAMCNVVGAVVVWPWWALYCGQGCCMAVFCVVGTVIAWLWWVSYWVVFVAWPQWVSSHCVVSWVLSLCGCGGHCVTLPRWVSSHCVLYCGCHSCMAVVGVVVLRFVLQALLLRGCSGRRVALLWWVSLRCILCHRHCRCMAMVGVMLWSHLLHGHGGCHHTVLCRGQGCCVVMVGVVAPHGTAVIGPQKRKLAEKREKKKRKMHQRVCWCE